MRVFQSTYKDRNGGRRKTEVWYAEVRDRHGKPRRIPGFTDKRATQELDRKLERLVSLRLAGEQPDIAMIRWLEGLPTKTREQLGRIGVLDPKAVA